MEVKRICQWCGKPFIAQKTTTNYCSPQCSKRGYKHRMKERRMELIQSQDLLEVKKRLENQEYFTFSQAAKLMGVREDSRFGKQICVLSEDLKGTIEPNILYSVELKPMHNAKGYVVVAATPVLFQAHVETIIVPKTLYQVTVTFGNKKIFFDPKDGKSAMSRTIDGVLEILKGRKDIRHQESVINDYLNQAQALVRRMESDGFIHTKNGHSGRSK